MKFHKICLKYRTIVEILWEWFEMKQNYITLKLVKKHEKSIKYS